MPLRNRYRLVDLATQGYLVFVAVAALLFHGQHWQTLVGLHVFVMVMVHGVVRFGSGPRTPVVLGWFRDFYPILLYFGLYSETLLLNHMSGVPRLDPWLARADHAVFGCVAAEAFPAHASHWLFSEFMHLSYLSFYLMVGGVGFWLSLRNRLAFRHFVTVTSVAFYACYAFYLFVPAVGPRVLYRDTPERTAFCERYDYEPRTFSPAATAGWCYRTLDVIECHAEIPGAAFPSSHVAMALITVWFSWRYLRAIRWLHLFFALSICLSTVYTRAHYGVDVLGGLVAAAVLLPLAQAAWKKWENLGNCGLGEVSSGDGGDTEGLGGKGQEYGG